MIYLDHASLTPMRPEVTARMQEAIASEWGHPLAVHGAGRRARHALEQARIEVASYLGCRPAELRWASSATAALRRALRFATESSEGPVVSSRIEHPAIREPLLELEARGREVRWLDAPAGEIAVEEARRAGVLEGAAVVALGAVNAELGTRTPIEGLHALAPGAWWIVDAVQAAPWLDVSGLLFERTFVVASSAKLGGPPGAAALRVPRELAYAQAGAAESRFPEEPGALPWLAAIGMGAACRVRQPLRAEALERARGLGGELLAGLRTTVPGVVHDAGPSWLGPIVNVAIRGTEGRAIEAALDVASVCISRASACQQTSDAGSPVVLAAYPDEPWRARAATRWSVGMDTNSEELAGAVERFRGAVAALGLTGKDGRRP